MVPASISVPHRPQGWSSVSRIHWGISLFFESNLGLCSYQTRPERLPFLSSAKHSPRVHAMPKVLVDPPVCGTARRPAPESIWPLRVIQTIGRAMMRPLPPLWMFRIHGAECRGLVLGLARMSCQSLAAPGIRLPHRVPVTGCRVYTQASLGSARLFGLAGTRRAIGRGIRPRLIAFPHFTPALCAVTSLFRRPSQSGQ